MVTAAWLRLLPLFWGLWRNIRGEPLQARVFDSTGQVGEGGGSTADYMSRSGDHGSSHVCRILKLWWPRRWGSRSVYRLELTCGSRTADFGKGDRFRRVSLAGDIFRINGRPQAVGANLVHPGYAEQPVPAGCDGTPAGSCRTGEF